MNKEVRSCRAESFLRIQRRDEFKEICYRDDYQESKAGESTLFRKRLPRPREEKRTGETGPPLIAQHLEATNKGYDPDFKDYDTYDERRNRNYDKDKSKFRIRL